MRGFIAVGACCLLVSTAAVSRAQRPRGPANSSTLTVDQRQALAHLREGQRLMRAESFGAADDEFSAAARLDPLLVMAHYGLGQARMAQKDFDAAIQAYVGGRDAFDKVRTSTATNRMALAQARDDEARDLQDAIRETEAALRSLSPGSSAATRLNARVQRLETQIDTLDQLRGIEIEGGRVEMPPFLSLALGSAYFRSGRMDEAERAYLQAVAARPRFGEAHNNLAVVYLETGRPQDALKELKLAEKSGFRVHPDLKKTVEKALGEH